MRIDYVSFQVGTAADEIIIEGDEAGLLRLAGSIQKLVASTKPGHFNHDHLMSEAWGGAELSQDNSHGKTIHHVKIYCHKGAVCQM